MRNNEKATDEGSMKEKGAPQKNADRALGIDRNVPFRSVLNDNLICK